MWGAHVVFLGVGCRNVSSKLAAASGKQNKLLSVCKKLNITLLRKCSIPNDKTPRYKSHIIIVCRPL